MHRTAQHNYVISLTTAVERRKHIEEQFGKQNIPFAFFDAITPDQIEDVAKKFNITLDRSDKAKLWDGEIACALSHIVLWDFLLEQNLDYLNIFEDDIHLGENVKALLEIDYLPNGTDILKLEANGKIIFKNPKEVKCNRSIYPITFKQSGTAGYTITRKGANYLLNKVKNKPMELAIDSLIFEELLNEKEYKILQLSPAICVQDFVLHPDKPFESSLQKGRDRVYENQTKTSILEKIKNELIRVKRKLLMKPVTFK
ncbi:glycosyltransferase family 25 protein [Rodentibacter myodis]|uniref:Lipooligosaccharide biosynthesis protein lpsA n=1 Tax=Rodentibacter myodis TaxID=1907939 RepID=A0A1V3JLC1_9PAST|nr:glycosyltransferase family 25 protein [Rodentibacter myodis]OOF57590.1 lipooligosaccharide biosynthesis protein lpsA [Rodentibacter myodis]